MAGGEPRDAVVTGISLEAGDLVVRLPRVSSSSICSDSVTRRRLLRILGGGLAASATFAVPAQLASAQATATPAPTSAPTSTPVPRPTVSVAPTAGPAAPAASPSAVPSAPPATPATAAPSWLQALKPIPLWSGYDDNAEQLGTAARWDYFQIAQPQVGSRIEVYVARTKGIAWVDALSVGPSGPPPPGWPPPNLPPPPTDLNVSWVATTTDAPLWADPDGTLPLGVVGPWIPFKQIEDQQGSRIHVQDPYAAGDGYLDAANVGPVDQPDKIGVPAHWWGVLAVDGAHLRPGPTTRQDALGELAAGSPVVVAGWEAGEEVIPDNPTWARLAQGAYLHSSVFRPVALPAVPPPPSDANFTGNWIDLNLTQQVVVAYEGQNAVRVARTSTGRPGWETNPGLFRIQRRVANETMDSTSLIGLDAQRADYKVENVRWTQYFTSDGKALHENYWKPRDEFGIPSSHGCAGLVAEDAKFFWDWADVGTPIYSHA